MTSPDWSPFHLLRNAPREALIAKLEEQAQLHSDFAIIMTNKETAAIAQDLAEAYTRCVELIKSDRLVELLSEVRTMIPALNAAKSLLKAQIEQG